MWRLRGSKAPKRCRTPATSPANTAHTLPRTTPWQKGVLRGWQQQAQGRSLQPAAEQPTSAARHAQVIPSQRQVSPPLKHGAHVAVHHHLFAVLRVAQRVHSVQGAGAGGRMLRRRRLIPELLRAGRRAGRCEVIKAGPQARPLNGRAQASRPQQREPGPTWWCGSSANSSPTGGRASSSGAVKKKVCSAMGEWRCATGLSAGAVASRLVSSQMCNLRKEIAGAQPQVLAPGGGRRRRGGTPARCRHHETRPGTRAPGAERDWAARLHARGLRRSLGGGVRHVGARSTCVQLRRRGRK